MLERLAYDSLKCWKSSARRKVLLVDGARQTGKTYLIESFAQAEYDEYVRIVCSWYKMRGSSEFRRAPHRFCYIFQSPCLGNH